MQHAQMLREDQFKRIKEMGMGVNFFSNHIYYWGDQHYSKTMGPERAMRMDACGSAVRHGIPFAFHSDCGITPHQPTVHRLVRGEPPDGIRARTGRSGKNLRRSSAARDDPRRGMDHENGPSDRQHRMR